MKILVGADLVATENNYELFKCGNAEALVGKEIKQIIEDSDFRIYNLELALTDNPTPISKCGPNILAPTECINGYKALKADLLGIANNHVLDHGYEGFVSTIKTLDTAGIKTVGAGMDKEQAQKPFIIEKDGKKVGVYACCEHEFSWVEDYGFGCNGFDPLESLDHIVELKKNCDYVIVLYHGGKEHYPYPSPRLQKVCRKIVEKGADIVLCQHTHCVGAEEDCLGGKIIYGQGNFVFAKNYAHLPTWGDGFLVLIDLAEKDVKLQYIPFNKTDVGIAIDNSGKILEGLKTRSEQIKANGFIEQSFAELAEKTVVSRYVQHMIGRTPTEEELQGEMGKQLFHCAECEVHYECLLTGLRKKLGLGKWGETKR